MSAVMSRKMRAYHPVYPSPAAKKLPTELSPPVQYVLELGGHGRRARGLLETRRDETRRDEVCSPIPLHPPTTRMARSHLLSGPSSASCSSSRAALHSGLADGGFGRSSGRGARGHDHGARRGGGRHGAPGVAP